MFLFHILYQDSVSLVFVLLADYMLIRIAIPANVSVNVFHVVLSTEYRPGLLRNVLEPIHY